MTRKTWRGPADPSPGPGPTLNDVFVYACRVAVFQRLLGVTLGKRGVKQTKLRGIVLSILSPLCPSRVIIPVVPKGSNY